jgi:hypothetical protein
MTNIHSIEEMLTKIEKGHCIIENENIDFCDNSPNISFDIIAKWALEEILFQKELLASLHQKLKEERRKK